MLNIAGARLDMNPRLPSKELLKIVDAPNEIGNLPIEVLHIHEKRTGQSTDLRQRLMPDDFRQPQFKSILASHSATLLNPLLRHGYQLRLQGGLDGRVLEPRSQPRADMG